MRNTLLIILLTIAACFGTKAQSTSPIDQVTNAYNSKCPLPVTDGATLVSVALVDEGVLFSNTITDQLFDNLEGLRPILHDSLVAEMASSPDKNMQTLIALCKSTGTNIIQRFTNSKGKPFDIIILPSEL